MINKGKEAYLAKCAFALALTLGLSISANTLALSMKDIEIHGFFTAGATISNVEKNYLRTTNEDISFDEDSALGLQIFIPIDDKITLQAQILANSSKQAEPDFEAEVDWAFVSYQLSDTLLIRGGRIRYPLLMHGDYAEVGYSYPWIRPPQVVYGNIPITAVDGVDLVATIPMGDVELTVQPFVASRDDSILIQDLNRELDADLNNMVGLKLALQSEHIRLHATVLNYEWSLDKDQPAMWVVENVMGLGAIKDAEVNTYALGVNVDWNSFVFMSEYVHIDYEREKGQFALPGTEGWYAMAGYQMGKWLPHVTYGQRDAKSTLGVINDNLTLGLRYDLTPSAALKFEWSNINPEPAFGPFSGDTQGPVEPTPYGAFEFPAYKNPNEGAQVYSIAIDVIF